MGNTWTVSYTTDPSSEKGWEFVEESRGIPETVMTECKKILPEIAAYSCDVRDRYKNPPGLAEIRSNDRYVYVIETQYDLRDKRGRYSVCSRAHVLLSSSTNVLKDANVFLTISKDNFATNSIKGFQENALSNHSVYTLCDSMGAVNLSYTVLSRLLMSVYRYMTSNPTEPLYIQVERREEQINAIIYCIYQAIPWFLRRRFICLTSPIYGASPGQIVLTTQGDVGSNWFDIKSGNNSILSNEDIKDLSCYGFVNYVAEKKMDEKDANEYYEKLESFAKQIGDFNASSLRALKLAHVYHTESCSQYDDDYLPLLLLDAVDGEYQESTYLDKCVEIVLQELVDRDISLQGGEIVGKLKRYVDSSESCILKKCYHRYALDQTKSSPGLFTAYFDVSNEEQIVSLAKSDEGRIILDCYYSNMVDNLDEISWESLSKIKNKLKAHKIECSQTVKSIKTKADELLRNSTQSIYSENPFIIDEYLKLIDGLVDERECQDIRRDTLNQFWSGVTFNNIDFKSKKLYESFRTESDRAQMFLQYLKLLSDFDNGAEIFIRGVYEFFRNNSSLLADESSKTGIDSRVGIERLCEEWYRPTGTADKYLCSWAKVVSYLYEVHNSDTALNYVMQLRRAINNKCYIEVVQYCAQIHLLDGANEEIKDNICKKCVDIVLNIYVDFELTRPRRAVDLDGWIGVSIWCYNNPFYIFDSNGKGCNALILKRKTREVLHNSVLFNEDWSQRSAEKYVREAKSDGSRMAVQEWIEQNPFRNQNGSRKNNIARTLIQKGIDRGICPVSQLLTSQQPINAQRSACQPDSTQSAFGAQRGLNTEHDFEPQKEAGSRQVYDVQQSVSPGRKQPEPKHAEDYAHNNGVLGQQNHKRANGFKEKRGQKGKRWRQSNPSTLKLIKYLAVDIILIIILPPIISFLAYYFFDLDIMIILSVETAYIFGYFIALYTFNRNSFY